MDWLFHLSYWWLSCGIFFLGAVCGLAGVLVLLQKQSLMGDAISHAAFPGIVIMFILFQTKSTMPLLIGAAIVGLIGNFLVNHIIQNTKLKTDAALGIVLSSFFGFGILLYSYIPQLKIDTHAGLERFLFGQGATILQEEVYWIVFWFFSVIALLLIFYKEIKLALFDHVFAQSIGLPVNKMKAAMGIIVVVSIVTGLQAAGVILISTLLLAPAAAARQWSRSFHQMLILAALIGGFGALLGLIVSILLIDFPTGPVIVVILSFIVIISLIFPRKKSIETKTASYARTAD